MPTSGFRLFKLFGITVYLNWMWVFAPIYIIYYQKGFSIAWDMAEVFSLFLIVLMHEFGHALACISVGGKADRIVLWPLGGIAFVDPPRRPGAMLWSIVAGPLVNVALLPITLPFYLHPGQSDFRRFLAMVGGINLGLLLFNLLPIYPLDGGKILQSLLWYMMGLARSLMVAASIGLVGCAALGILALWIGDRFLGIIALWAIFNAYSGFQYARALHRRESIPRRTELHCPACGSSPPRGPAWICSCGNSFDMFEHEARCPACGRSYQSTSCMDCGALTPILAWGIYHPAITISASSTPVV